MSMQDIYTQLILEHSRNPQNRRKLREVSREQKGHNPSCGDEIHLALHLEGERIEDAAYSGQGCAISQASTSMMIDAIRGLQREEAMHLCHAFIRMIKGETLSEEEMEALEDAASLESIRNLPARVKCATLPWYTLLRMLEETPGTDEVKTE